MVIARMDRQVDKVSELLAFVVRYDPETLADLREWFDQIAQMAADTLQPDVARVALAASRVSERLLLDQVMDREMSYSFPDLDTGTESSLEAEREIQEEIREDILHELMGMSPERQTRQDSWSPVSFDADNLRPMLAWTQTRM